MPEATTSPTGAEPAAPTDAAGVPGATGNAGGIGAIASKLQEMGGQITKFSEGLSGTPFAGFSPGLQKVGAGLDKAGSVVSELSTAIADTSGGPVGNILGVADTALGLFSGGGSQGADGEQSSLDKVREKVGHLKEIWDEYYGTLRDSEGKWNKERLKGLANEVGEVILGTKKMEAIRKILAIRNIIRSGAEAIMTAAASAPFPANLVPIAKAKALEVAQMSVVKGQAHDGLDRIPSTGTYLLEKGERVVGNRLNSDLSSFLRSQRSAVDPDGTGVARHYGATTVNNSPSVSLTINGNASPDAVQSNRSALERMIRDIFADHAMPSPFDA